ncbi:MAG: NADH oxidase (H2O2-forming) [Sulfurimonas sp.]|jgi:NADH oxidase (H2O2-forming)|uniref:FAD-dependent oxidoreductase n=1 Tax=Sulfurimonas sp. TaxID=2022749 RepID=UPI0039E66EC7
MNKESVDILIIGGGPSGGVCAVTAKMNNPDKRIMVIREHEKQLVPCSIPYIFGKTLGSVENGLGSCAMATQMGIEAVIGEVKDIDIKNKIAYYGENAISFDKLVIATGSVPFVHESLQHSLSLNGVFTIAKSVELITKLKKYADDKQNIIIVGSGFIGVEIAMEFAGIGKNVIMVGGSKYILNRAFDSDIAQEAQKIVEEAGVTYIGSDRVVAIMDKNDDNTVNAVKLESGKILDTDLVILATGYQPNTTLATKVGISLGHYGGIWVDDYMRTQNQDIFAIGDCTARRGFISKAPSKVMLASTSAAEARVAGSSIYGIKYLKGMSGTISIFSTKIGDTVFASAGVTSTKAEAKTKTTMVIGSFQGINRHPRTIPGAHKQYVKLIVSRYSGQILGGQVIGSDEAGEIINLIGQIIESGRSVYSVMSMQVATQPLLTGAPTNYPLIMAAIMAIKEIES